jgi:hypothetical protein
MIAIFQTGVCVRCGKNDTTDHHIVPKRFLKHFENRINNKFNHWFIIKLCECCHKKYEKMSHRFDQSVLNKILTEEEKNNLKKNEIVHSYLITKSEIEKKHISNNFNKNYGIDIKDYISKNSENIKDKYNIAVCRLGELAITKLWVGHFFNNFKSPYLSLDQLIIFNGELDIAFKDEKLKTS